MNSLSTTTFRPRRTAERASDLQVCRIRGLFRCPETGGIPQGFRRRSVQIVIRIASGRVAAALRGMALGSGHELDSSLDALMPAADFSEFSYGYAVVREAEDLLTTLAAGLVSAPTLPSLIKENTVGYDAHLVSVDFALFLQFKRSFFVSRQHTSGACGYIGPEPHCTWAFWNTEHYRFDVDMSSNQFHAMRGYETDIALTYGSCQVK